MYRKKYCLLWSVLFSLNILMNYISSSGHITLNIKVIYDFSLINNNNRVIAFVIFFKKKKKKKKR
jgi:hypothetical protein